ncbi:hypothetical protein [Aequorivita antarctica]|uniref:TerB family tellurite resistance protein n=1 Tax=Aequorivita antarctica TaxID=153266 RepID=A0A5C6YXC0_9FLAO|nr:hypothetical protein [Aequorivita antarctica]TXD72347.1 hypothetical protein ESU54_13070 [Aequorivita antarctica]SRX74489.1 hypothetical protein AEQU3_01468 [Aequorivita antarctica]
MKTGETQWSKEELKTYILILCAKADKVEAEEEIALIKTKTSNEIFDKMYREFQNDDEDESLEKIQNALEWHQYSELELCELKNEIQQIFAADRKIPMSESNLGRILENIIY